MVLGFGVTYPFDKVVDASSVGRESRIDNLFHFVVFVFAFNDIGGRTSEIRSVLRRFLIGEEKGIVEDWVDVPCVGQLEM